MSTPKNRASMKSNPWRCKIAKSPYIYEPPPLPRGKIISILDQMAMSFYGVNPGYLYRPCPAFAECILELSLQGNFQVSDNAEKSKRVEGSESALTERRASEIGKNEVDQELPAWTRSKQEADEKFKAAGLEDKPRDNFVSGTIGRVQIEGDNGEILVKGIPAKAETQEQQDTPSDTVSELTLRAMGDTDPRAQAMYEIRKGIKAHMPEGEARDQAITVARQTEKELFQDFLMTDDTMSAYDSLPVINPEMVANSNHMEGQITEFAQPENNPIGWFEAAHKISQLPFEKQIEIIGTGLGAGFTEYNQQQTERSIGALIGTVQGAGTIATNLGKIADFSAYLLINDHERAGQVGAEFGEALGESIVGGFRLFEGAHKYLNDVGKAGYEGDYTKVFRDIDNLGKHLDKAWSELPPREQSRILSKLGTELAADGLIGLGAAKAAGNVPSQLTKILDTVSHDAQRLHLASRKVTRKSVNALLSAFDDIFQPMADTGMGVKLPVPKSSMTDGSKMLMSQADNLNGQEKLVNRGMDAAGKGLKFSDESGIELGELRLGQDKVWEQATFPRGDDIHVVLGENLPAGTKTIDRVVIKDGIVEGQKSIDLTADSYADPKKLESRLRSYVSGMKNYDGQKKPRMSFKMKEQEIDQKILHIGIKDSSMTEQQRDVFENIGKQILEYNDVLPIGKAPLRLKVTVVK
ncbi:hypothetical protein GC174_11500 [bacterium]|nr:hypothetical protein [bacterium]